MAPGRRRTDNRVTRERELDPPSFHYHGKVMLWSKGWKEAVVPAVKIKNKESKYVRCSNPAYYYNGETMSIFKELLNEKRCPGIYEIGVGHSVLKVKAMYIGSCCRVKEMSLYEYLCHLLEDDKVILPVNYMVLVTGNKFYLRWLETGEEWCEGESDDEEVDTLCETTKAIENAHLEKYDYAWNTQPGCARRPFDLIESKKTVIRLNGIEIYFL